jgi:hypothetical protein
MDAPGSLYHAISGGWNGFVIDWNNLDSTVSVKSDWID